MGVLRAKKLIPLILVTIIIAAAFTAMPREGKDDEKTILTKDRATDLLLASESEFDEGVDDSVLWLNGDDAETMKTMPYLAPLSVRARTGEYIPAILGPQGDKPVDRYLECTDRDLNTFIANDSATGSIEIAGRGWTSSESVILVSGYSGALLAGPLASYIGCPILEANAQTWSMVNQLLRELGVKYVVAIGTSLPSGGAVLPLTEEEVNEFYLMVLDRAGDSSDYIVVTNPWDIDGYPIDHSSLPIAGLSSVASHIASYRKASIVLADGYTDWDIEYGDGFTQMGVPYEVAVNTSKEIQNRIRTAKQPYYSYNMDLEYICMVGGPITLPFWYTDMTAYVEERQYTPSDYPYALNDEAPPLSGLPYQSYAIGRIMGRTPWSAAATVALTLGFEGACTIEWESDSSSSVYDTVSSDWKENSMMVVGTTKVGPMPGILTPTLANQTYTMTEAGFTATPLGYDAGQGDIMREIVDEMNYNVYYGHGDYDQWYTNAVPGWRFTADHVNAANLKPGASIAMACLTGMVDNLDIPLDQYFALAMMYSGSTAYIGASRVAYGLYDIETQHGSVIRGTGALYLVDMFTEQVCKYDNDVGVALMNAKNSLMDVQGYDESEGSAGFEGAITVTEYVLFGDPAHNMHIPDHD